MRKAIIILMLILFAFTGAMAQWVNLGTGVQPRVKTAIEELRIYGTGLPKILGTWYFVDPENGASTNGGTSIATAFASISSAYTACTTGDGDGIVILSSGITTANTTSYLDEALDWTKHGITVYGVCAPTRMYQRARISTDSDSDLVYIMDIQGNNNTFYNVHFYNGGDSSICVGGIKVTGSRNAFVNVHVASPASHTATANDYALFCSGEENTYVDCVFGTDTYDSGDNANCEIFLDGTGYRNRFYGCETIAYVSTGTAHGAVESADATSIGRHVIFTDCIFTVFQANTGRPAMASWFIGTAPTSGAVIVAGNSLLCGYAEWDSNASNNRVYVAMPTTAASAAGGVATTN